MPDPLEELRERLGATQAAAERLAGEAPAPPSEPPAAEFGRRAGRRRRTAPRARRRAQALVALLQALREVVPLELQAQGLEVIRQAPLPLRAIIDLWVARPDPEGSGAAAAETAHPPAQQRFEDILIE